MNHSYTYVCMASMASMLAPCSRESIQASNSLCVGSSVQSLRARIFWCAREQQSRDVCIRYYLNSLLWMGNHWKEWYLNGLLKQYQWPILLCDVFKYCVCFMEAFKGSVKTLYIWKEILYSWKICNSLCLLILLQWLMLYLNYV